ncbi:DUF4129 domain-containing protein [Lacinutrix sp. WUR7]|nr:DUF4129 domain-containing protein [Lacinutrix sp. WUR7]
MSSWAFCQQDTLNVQYDDSKLTEQQIHKEDLNKYKNDKNFNYTETVPTENFLNKIIRWFKNIITKIFEWIFGVGNATGILKFIFEVVPYLLLAFLIFLLLKFFLKINSKNIITGKQNQATVAFTEEEQIIKNEDILALIHEAVQQQNYRLAIRYYYLLSLKKLTEGNIISWEQQKTNEDYLSEIKTKSLQSGFADITKIYDYVWYGEFEVDALRFEKLKSPFETLHKNIKP